MDVDTQNTTLIQRKIGEYGTANSGPVFFVIGGMHGNEPSGVQASQQVLQELNSSDLELRGQVHFLAGNVAALNQGVRFVDSDLNRMWADDFEERLERCSEYHEKRELSAVVQTICNGRFDNVYALDLHTTSGDTLPFVTIDDALPNRDFAMCTGAPIILGIEEHVHGSVLEFFNEQGATVIGFEGGQHTSEVAVNNHRRVIYSALVYAGLTTWEELFTASIQVKKPEFPSAGEFFEIIHRHALDPNKASFVMNQGYSSFQPVAKGDIVAKNDSRDVRIEKTGFILMPLYQRLGSEGYFLIRKVHSVWLKLSRIVRKMQMHTLLLLLPGVKGKEGGRVLLVNTAIARLFPVQIMHLAGFRRVTEIDHKTLRFTKRRDN